MDMRAVFCLCCLAILSSVNGYIIPTGDIFNDFTHAAPLHYLVNVSNCMYAPPYNPKFKAGILSEVISAGILYSSSDGTWDMNIGNQKYIDGALYNLSIPVLCVTSVPMSDQGQAYIYMYDLDPESSSILSMQSLTCFTGQKNIEIAFTSTNQTKTALYSYADVKTALTLGLELTFSYNLDGKSNDNRFYYVTGRINGMKFYHPKSDFSTHPLDPHLYMHVRNSSGTFVTVSTPRTGFSLLDDDLSFSTELPDELGVTVYKSKVSRDNNLTLSSWKFDRKGHSIHDRETHHGSIDKNGSFRIYRLDGVYKTVTLSSLLLLANPF